MLGRTLIELPAGTLEAGEDPRSAALRELAEETGFRAATMEPLARFFASPGITDEVLHGFVARGLVDGTQDLDATESIERMVVTTDEALDLIRSGTIEDGKTLALLLRHRALPAG